MSNIFGPQPRRRVLRHGGYSLAMCRQRSIQSDAGWCLRGTEAHGARLSELSCTVTLRQGTGHTRGCCGRLRPRCCWEQAKLRLSWSSETLGSKAVSSVNPRRLSSHAGRSGAYGHGDLSLTNLPVTSCQTPAQCVCAYACVDVNVHLCVCVYMCLHEFIKH